MISAEELQRLESLYRLSNAVELARLARYASEVSAAHEIVEIGSWAGGSAAWLSAGSAAGMRAHVTCVDIWVDWRDPPPGEPIVKGEDARQKFLEVTDPAYVTALHGSSEQVAAMWMKPVGLLFIDDGHSWPEIERDYLSWRPHVAPGGVLAIHDYIPDWDAESWWAKDPTDYVDRVVIPSGEWEPLGVTEWTWFGRRLSS